MAAPLASTAVKILSQHSHACEACATTLARRIQRTAVVQARRQMHVHSQRSLHASTSSAPSQSSPSISTYRRHTSVSSKQTTRQFHSSRKRAFIPLFGFKRKIEEPYQLSQEFIEALEAQDAEKLARSYLALRKMLLADTSLVASDFLSIEQLTAALPILAQTSYINDDFLALRRIYDDLPTRWNQQDRSNADQSSYFTALINSGRWVAAAQMLKSSTDIAPLSTKTSTTWSATSEDWNRFLPHALSVADHSKRYHYGAVKDWVLNKMPAEQRNLSTYLILIQALFDTPRMSQQSHILKREMEWIETTCLKLQLTAQEKQQLYAAQLQGYLVSSETDLAQIVYDKILKAIEETEGQKATQEALLALVRFDTVAGIYSLDKTRSPYLAELVNTSLQAVPSMIMDNLVDNVDGLSMKDDNNHSLDDLRRSLGRVELSTGLLPDFKAYEKAIRYASSFEDAIALYEDSHRDGIELSSDMLRAIVSKIPPGAATRDHIETVKNLYGDLGRSKLSDVRSRDGLHDPATYIQLLELCANKTVRDLDWATSILEDMKANGLSFLNGDEVTAHPEVIAQNSAETKIATTSAAYIVTMLMTEVASNHSQAFKPYSWMWAIDPDHIFSKRDWYDIIRTYTDLEFSSDSGVPTASYVPVSIYFAFFEDMRQSATPPTSRMYQAILHYYARESTQPDSNANAVRLIHDLIKMDHYYDPDIGLMNRLMFAYSKTGNMKAAEAVWRSVLINQIPFNNVSISIILDTYGYLNEFEKAKRLWSNLQLQKYPLNKKNVESYIECACRTGNLQEAVQETLALASNKGNEAIYVDEHTLKILLKFARSDSKVYYSLRKDIERHFPHLWPSVETVGQSKSTSAAKLGSSSKGEFFTASNATPDASVKIEEKAQIPLHKS